ncbi:MAG: hypothetical protein JXA33_06600 [Anaerolineae bacterium]|nr:hypothetical protein [Anaerolineae bacterium]
MLTNELLEAKYRAQRALAEQGGDDLNTYVEHVQRMVREVEQKYGIKFHYRGNKGAEPALEKKNKSSECET